MSKEELEFFFNSSDFSIVGKAYEWEGENVVHIHTDKIKHSFGSCNDVLFLKEDNDANEGLEYLYVVYVSKQNDEITAKVHSKSFEVEVNYIPKKQELYSRNKGILEVNVLEEKRVMIVGLGSFGSQIAIELAKAGVGEFSLFDFDRVELHNLARHTATVKDLGRLKTDVIEESIKGKNPYACVKKYAININEHLDLMEDEVAKADIVICATDNNESRFNLSSTLVHQKKVGLFGRAVTRAEGGDVFRYRPGGPCYCCLIGNQWFGLSEGEVSNVASARRNGQIAAYVSERDADAFVQVGLSADIEPICNMMVKLALMELSRGVESGISCLENELIYDYYMWANRRERRHANWAAMPGAGSKPTIMRWYGAHIPKNDNCSLCSDREVLLDEGGTIRSKYGDMINLDMSGLSVEE
ncbi:MAG: ThiF family adenylyltransferase [Bacteroidales bacterium]|nr:ThiF family adenylyltransferase [Candidatus Physcocola equi]